MTLILQSACVLVPCVKGCPLLCPGLYVLNDSIFVNLSMFGVVYVDAFCVCRCLGIFRIILLLCNHYE